MAEVADVVRMNRTIVLRGADYAVVEQPNSTVLR
jgi:hypothetical protein